MIYNISTQEEQLQLYFQLLTCNCWTGKCTTMNEWCWLKKLIWNFIKNKKIFVILKYLFKSSVEITDQYQSCHKKILKGRIVFSRISCWYIHVLWCVTVIEFNELYFTVLLSHKLTLYNVRILSTKNIFDVIFEPLRLYSLHNTVTKQYWALLCVYHYVYLWSPCYMSLQSQSSVNYCTLRELDGRGHFLTVFISCWRRALYKNVGNYATLKAEILEIFFTK